MFTIRLANKEKLGRHFTVSRDQYIIGLSSCQFVAFFGKNNVNSNIIAYKIIIAHVLL